MVFRFCANFERPFGPCITSASRGLWWLFSSCLVLAVLPWSSLGLYLRGCNAEPEVLSLKVEKEKSRNGKEFGRAILTASTDRGMLIWQSLLELQNTRDEQTKEL